MLIQSKWFHDRFLCRLGLLNYASIFDDQCVFLDVAIHCVVLWDHHLFRLLLHLHILEGLHLLW